MDAQLKKQFKAKKEKIMTEFRNPFSDFIKPSCESASVCHIFLDLVACR